MEMTFVYGNPLFKQRRLLWDKLERLMPSNGGSWCCVGDFNEMYSITEKEGSRPVAPIRITLFREFMNSTSLMDLDLKGNKYTWISNPRDGILTKQEIDSVLVNWGWRGLYPHDVGVALPIVN